MDALKLILDPANANLTPGEATLALAVSTAVAATSLTAAALFLRRAGQRGGELAPYTALIGLCFVLGVIVVPMALTASLFPGREIGQGRMTLASLQVCAALCALFLMARLELDPEKRVLRAIRVDGAALARAGTTWILSLPGVIGALVLSVCASRLANVEILPQGVLETALSDRSPQGIAASYLLAVVAAPLVEEFVFRLVLYGGLARWIGPRGALVLSALLFVLAHNPFAAGQAYLFLPLLALGLVLGEVYARTRNFWAPVLVHALHNLLALTLAFLLRPTSTS